MKKYLLEELYLYNEAVKLRRHIFKLTAFFPPEEKFKLRDQMIRCSRSCKANIAEGYGRFHFKESIQFYRISRGSLFELRDHLSVAIDCSYINNSEYEKTIDQTNQVLTLLSGFIRYIRKQKEKNTRPDK